MASTAPKTPVPEHHETPTAISQKAQAFVDLLQKSKYFIAFTGAGVSTSAGIADFRGPNGVWTLRRQGRERDIKSISTLEAIPSPTHMALVELQDRGVLKYLVSQNCDGLHRRSGIRPDMISELHGNSNREYCKDCGKEYIRDFRAVATYETSILDHRTGRKCTRCNGELHDSIINFSESLPALPFQRAESHAKRADLCLVLGSSLTVTPANEIPEIMGRRKGGKLVICNLQDTPIDELSGLRVHARTDEFMGRVMEMLGIAVPRFVLRRRLVVRVESRGEERHQVTVAGVDVDGTPVTFLKSVRLEFNRRVVRSEPFVIGFRGSLDPGTLLKLELEFMGHYGEPNLKICHECTGRSDAEMMYLLEYNPHIGEWKVSRQNDRDFGEGIRDDVEKQEGRRLNPVDPDNISDDVRPI